LGDQQSYFEPKLKKAFFGVYRLQIVQKEIIMPIDQNMTVDMTAT